MGRNRKAFLTMAAFSAVTLLLGVSREFLIARELRASGDADMFFRGLVVVAAVRSFAAVLFRARWVPLGTEVSAWRLARAESRIVASLMGVGLASLWLMFSSAERGHLAAWVFAAAVFFGVAGGVVRALAEREGLDRIAFGSEWALPLCTMLGAVLVGRGALGPTLGFTIGLFVAMAIPLPFLSRKGSRVSALPPRDGMRALLLDTVLYVNLGLVDAALSTWVYAPGEFAKLNYGYLFVNAVLAVPTAAATVVALRIASRDTGRKTLRLWALLAGVSAAISVGGLALVFQIQAVSETIAMLAGWDLAEAASPMLIAAIPFAGLRLANAVGRQQRVATAPETLVRWDAIGLVTRTLLLIGLAPVLGIVASPLALGLAELIQLAAWLPRRRNR